MQRQEFVHERLFHVVWKPGSESLLGECWCGRVRDSPDPISLWDWMDGHDHLGVSNATPEPDPTVTSQAPPLTSRAW